MFGNNNMESPTDWEMYWIYGKAILIFCIAATFICIFFAALGIGLEKGAKLLGYEEQPKTCNCGR